MRPRDIITRESLENAIAAIARSGGSTNGVLHLLAIAREAGVELDIDDFDRISREHAAAVRHEAGRPVRRGRPVRGRRHRRSSPSACRRRACCTTTRRPSPAGPSARRRPRPRRPRASRSCARSTTRSRRPAAWRSCAATWRRRAAWSSSPVTSARSHRGPARVFEREEDAMAAVTGSHPGRRRRRDPLRGPERRPGDARDARRDGGDRGRGARRERRPAHRRALLRRDPRPHGRARRPGGRRGGPIAAVQDGDEITFDVEGAAARRRPERRRIARRVEMYEAPPPAYETGVLAKYAKLVSSASAGAVTG